MIENNVNIGLLIEQKINELGINKSELARRIGMANQNINRIFEKKSIDTDKLVAISNALGYNFFQEYKETGVSETCVPGDSAAATGDGSVAMVGDNSGSVVAGGSAAMEERVRLLERLLDERERTIEEKERTIQILLRHAGGGQPQQSIHTCAGEPQQ